MAKGGDWKYRVYFDPEADKNGDKTYIISDNELRIRLVSLVDADEKIRNVTAYKVNLKEWQLTQFIFYHMFIVFETDDWFWSIEKNSEGITIQRSKYLHAVKDRYRQNPRNSGIEMIKTDYAERSVTVYELIRMLCRRNELNNMYTFLDSNCQAFGECVFNFLAFNERVVLYHRLP